MVLAGLGMSLFEVGVGTVGGDTLRGRGWVIFARGVYYCMWGGRIEVVSWVINC